MKQRKDGRWVKVVTIDGKGKSFYSKEKDEKRATRDIEKQMLAFREIRDKGVRFDKAANEYMSSCAGIISETTYNRYDCYAKRAIDFFGSKYVPDISLKEINTFLDRMAKQEYSAKTIKDNLSVLSQIFRFARIQFGSENANIQYAQLPKHAKPSVKRDALTEEEQKIVNNSIDKTFGLFAFFLLYTGLRRGEAIALKWSDIDFDNKLIHVRRTAIFPTSHGMIKEPKTEAGYRDVILLDKLAAVLPRKHSDDFVFSGKNLMYGTWYGKQWNKFQSETGLTVTPHQLRHTFATILFEADVSEKDAQQIMGHADISTTHNIYTHIRDSRMKQTADKLNAHLSDIL